LLVDRPVAIVGAWEAVVLGVALRDYQRRGGFARMSALERRLIDEAIAEIEAAGAARSVHERSAIPTLAALPHTGDVLLTTAVAAEILGISVSGVRRLMGTGVLSAVKVGRAVRFRRDDIDEFIEQRKTA
jgi:excisionase family DNA binding protein